MRSRRTWVSAIVVVASCATTTSISAPRYSGVTTCGREPVMLRDHEPRPDQRVRDAIERRARSFEACFLRSGDAVATTARFTIGEDGTVAGAEVHGTVAAIDRCLCERLVAARFPKLETRTTVTYPFMFVALDDF
jgi:hypothetical protein